MNVSALCLPTAVLETDYRFVRNMTGYFLIRLCSVGICLPTAPRQYVFEMIISIAYLLPAVLVLHIQHLFIYLLHGHPTSEHGSHRQITTMTRITSCHHVLGIKHLLSEFWNSQRSILLTASRRERCETRHKEMKTRERNHIHS